MATNRSGSLHSRTRPWRSHNAVVPRLDAQVAVVRSLAVEEEVGLPAQSLTVTVGPTGNYATLQEGLAAVADSPIDAVVELEAGTYNLDAAPALTAIMIGDSQAALTIQAASSAVVPHSGVPYVSGGKPNGVVGLVTLAGGGSSTVTVTGTVSNPDFSAVAAGTQLLAWAGTSNAVVELTVASAAGNTITVSGGTFPATIGSDGNGFTLLPAVRLVGTATLTINGGRAPSELRLYNLHFAFNYGPALALRLDTEIRDCVCQLGLNLVRGELRLVNTTIMHGARDGIACFRLAALDADVGVAIVNTAVAPAVAYRSLLLAVSSSAKFAQGLHVVTLNGQVVVKEASTLVVLSGSGSGGGLLAVTKGNLASDEAFICCDSGSTMRLELGHASTGVPTTQDSFREVVEAADASHVTINGGTVTASRDCVRAVRGSVASLSTGAYTPGSAANAIAKASKSGRVVLQGCTTTGAGGEITAQGSYGGSTGTAAIGAGAVTGAVVGTVIDADKVDCTVVGH